MQMKEIINKVSELYRDELSTSKILQKELDEVTREQLKADLERGENITFARYQYLSTRKLALRREIDLHAKYCSGIAVARELLMDLGFDTEVI